MKNIIQDQEKSKSKKLKDKSEKEKPFKFKGKKDVTGTKFDPEIHATDPRDGKPVLTAKNKFRKRSGPKKKDGPDPGPDLKGGISNPDNWGWLSTTALITGLCNAFDPTEFLPDMDKKYGPNHNFTEFEDLVFSFDEYFNSKEIEAPTPGWKLIGKVGQYIHKRVYMPKTQAKLAGYWTGARERVGKFKEKRSESKETED